MLTEALPVIVQFYSVIGTGNLLKIWEKDAIMKDTRLIRGQCNLRPQLRSHIKTTYEDTPLLLAYKFQLISFGIEPMQIHSVKPPRCSTNTPIEK